MISDKILHSADIPAINVVPSNKLFTELGNNTYSFTDLVSEFIDNSIAARDEDSMLNVTIEIGVSEKNKNKSYFLIRDNALGIIRYELGDAISPAAKSGGKTLNEHGLGMKQAVASMGVLKYLVTKTVKDDEAILVEEFKFGEIPAKLVQVDWEQGTEICVTSLKDIVPLKTQTITTTMIPVLGARYRRLLNANNPKMKITVRMLDLDNELQDEGYQVVNEWHVKEIKPTYFHPSKRINEAVKRKVEFKGTGWKAEFTFGYAPKDEEYAEMDLEKPKFYEPYYVSMNKQGFDLIKHDRVIKFHQLSDLGIVNAKHPSLNYIRGEIDLIKGFTTSITKDNVLIDGNMLELVGKIKKFLEKNKLLEKKSYPSELPESLLRDRLAEHFKTRTLDPKKLVYTEYAVEGLGGYMDIKADDEIWEIKTNEVTGLDVYQLFGYLDMNSEGVYKGFLIGPGFKTGAQKACEHINKKHNVEIKLVHISEFPINHPPNQEETKKYIK